MQKVISTIIILLSIYSCSNQKKTKEHLKELDYTASCINHKLSKIKTDIEKLAHEYQFKIALNNNITPIDTLIHINPKNIFFYKPYIHNTSTAFSPFSGITIEKAKNKILKTKVLDSLFKKVSERNSIISKIYLLDSTIFLRTYPGIDTTTYIKSVPGLKKIIIKNSRTKQEISKKAYWTNKPFADPFGEDWIISCSSPLLYRDNYIGTISANICIKTLSNKYITSKPGKLLLVDTNGKILCCNKEASCFIHIPYYKQFQYLKPKSENIFIFENYSLLNHKNKNLRNAVKFIFSGENKRTFIMNKQTHTLYKSHIKETNWLLLKISN